MFSAVISYSFVTLLCREVLHTCKVFDKIIQNSLFRYAIIIIYCTSSFLLSVTNQCERRMAEPNNESITEGKASVFKGKSIFYNPVQEFNRDMSVAALTVFAEEFKNTPQKKTVKRPFTDNAEKNNSPTQNDPNQATDETGITVLEALSASGLRSLRYALEVPNVKKILANDFSRAAVEAMNKNIKENHVDDIVEAQNHDAVWLMQKLNFENRSIHAIDLDPYGCPTKFLDSAINCIADSGMLMVTCTDMAVLASANPETCYVKYGALSLRCSACHEMALRIALQSISSICGRYGKYIVPMLSFSADFYIRVFVKVFTSQKMCKRTSSKMSWVYRCNGCEMITLQPLGTVKQSEKGNMKYLPPFGPIVSSSCEHCKYKHRIGGPIWNDKLHDEEFVEKMLTIAQKGELGTHKRMIGMLTVIKEELNDVPLFYTIDVLSSKIHCPNIPLAKFRSALLNAGYRVSSSHCKVNSIKTDAPQTFIWDVFRQWVKTNPVAQRYLTDDQVTAAILSKEPECEISFEWKEGAVPKSTAAGLLRYQPNPLPFWGPGAKNRFNTTKENEKKQRNQNKKNRLKLDVPESNDEKLAENEDQQLQ
ncbi:tRNA (guanine(26)-N(2))-dimethyltransferase isoform X1 [Planococcus citri]